MKKTLFRIVLICFYLTFLTSLTGCQNKNEVISQYTEKMKNTYWSWIDTSPTAENASSYRYAHLSEDGTYTSVGYTHQDDKVVYKSENDVETWQVIIHKGKPCVKISRNINGRIISNYILIDVSKENNTERFLKSMYLPGEKYYDEDDEYLMTELTQVQYESEIREDEEKYNSKDKVKSESNKSSFTNKYGTATTRCAHSGCNKYIASSGDTNCCIQHSRRCLNCNKYIDEDAMYCMSCIKSSLER